MHECASHHPGDIGGAPGGMHHGSGAGPERGLAGAALRKRGTQGLHRLYRVKDQAGKSHLFLHLTALIAIILAGCTSAGNPSLEERNEELVCPTGQVKVCPSAVGTASRIKNDQGACYCQPRN